MAEMMAGRLVAKALKKEGVECVFLLCGGHVAPIYLGCEDEGIRLIDVRHEQSAAFAADGWARVTGRPGVALVTAGPGVTNSVTAIANAQRAEVPMIVLAGRSPMSAFEKGSLQEMNQLEVVRPITKWARCVPAVDRIPEYVAMAFRHALDGRPGPVFLEIPIDLLLQTAEEKSVAWPEGYRTESRPWGEPRYVRRAAELLRGAERPVVLGGSPLWWSRAAAGLERFADATHFPVFLNAMGRGALPPDHPLHFSRCRRVALKRADVVLSLGVPLDFRLGFGRGIDPAAKLVQVDIDGSWIGHNRAAEVGIIGDVGAVLEALGAEIGARPELPWVELLRSEESRLVAKIEAKCGSDEAPVNHYRLVRELAGVIDEDTIVIGDGGDIVVVAGRLLKVHRHGHWMDPGPMGCLGVGIPFAIAAKAARPDKKILILNGDGAFGITAMDFDTLVRFRLPAVAVIGNDAGWGQIRTPQVVFFGGSRSTGTDLSYTTRYDRLAEAMGGYGELVENPGDIQAAVRRAFASGKPAIVNVLLDPKGLEDEANTREMAI
ncbi:MAG: thiamine pyrophosphate-binding protein [bacterium]